MNRFIRLLCLVFLSFVITVACQTSDPVTQLSQDPITIGYSPWSGYYPLTIGTEKGFFKQEGINVKPDFNKEYIGQINAFRNGRYDGILIALGSVLNITETTPDVQVVLVVNLSQGGDAIVARQEIKTPQDLKGKVIGTRLGDFGELLVREMLKQNDISASDVKIINIKTEELASKLTSGLIDAGQAWQPYTTEAVNAGHHIIFDSRETPGLIPDVLVMRNSVVKERPEEMKAFLRGWFKSQEYWVNNPEEVETLVSKALDLDEEVSFSGLELTGLQRNLEIMQPGETTESLYFTAQLYADFFAASGVINNPPDLETLINPEILKELQRTSK